MSDELPPRLVAAKILKDGIERRRQKAESSFAAPSGSAALVQHWRDCAKSIAVHYWKLRDVAPDAAERARARSETYADCANQLEEAMRQNDQAQPPRTERVKQPEV